ncbi:2Fe-2S iron-sulfur cluster binding domain-containing protein [bacterium]|nr:2Fe-2S iron-sulfur cluster binding domain-containing protein [bacterium]
MRKEIKTQIQGYTELVQENEVLRKYATGKPDSRGQVARIINSLHPRTLRLIVSEVRQETASTTTLRLVSENGCLPPFQAGQYINLFVEVGNVRTSRPYSISSAPSQSGYYDITVRRVENGFVSGFLLDDVKPGDKFTSTAPAGHFYYNPLIHGNDLVFLAGGSGITPFLSMIRETTDLNLDRRVHLIYGSRTEADVIFLEELTDRAAKHRNLIVSLVISEPSAGYSGPTGFISAELIKELTKNIDEKTFYVCGPEAMYTFVTAELEKLNLPRRKVRFEVFGPPADITQDPGWPTHVPKDAVFKIGLKNGTSIKASTAEPLMNALERTGIVIPASCRSGDCSICRTKVLSGTVFQPKGVKVRKSDRKYGYIHPCMAYPLEDLELLL